MKNIYEVTATRNRKIKGVKGYFTAEEGYVVYTAYQVARSEEEAIDLAKLYIVNPFDQIRATFIRPE